MERYTVMLTNYGQKGPFFQKNMIQIMTKSEKLAMVGITFYIPALKKTTQNIMKLSGNHILI